jgi:hypothetical protein
MTPSNETSGSAPSCPFLTPVVADRLFVYPVSAYCRRNQGRPRIPAAHTLAEVCLTDAHGDCPGYLASQAVAG